MKKIFLLTFFIVVFLPISVFAEEIARFDIDITINEDATLSVIERIEYDFGNENRHGIYRDIPVRYKTDKGVRKKNDITVTAVTDADGNKYKYTVNREGNNDRVKIGDERKYVTGKKVYTISYTVEGAMNYFDAHDELYWNAVGGEWTIPISNVTTTVYAPKILKKTCFFGIFGAIEQCGSIKDVDAETVSFTQRRIAPGEFLTVVVGIEKGIIYKPGLWDKFLNILQNNLITLLPLTVTFYMWQKWRSRGKDPVGKGAIVPEYDSPGGVSPAMADLLENNHVGSKALSSLIVSLAVKGYLRIKQVGEKSVLKNMSYEFIKTESVQKEPLTVGEEILYEKLFSHGTDNTVTTSQLKNKFYKDLGSILSAVRKEAVSRGYYKKNPQNVRGAYIGIGVIFLFATFFFGGFLGFFNSLMIGACAIPIVAFGIFMPQKTRQGALVNEAVQGLKLYMETAEKDRINFHNAPEKRPEQFEKLLPFAMALGVEKAWAKQFEDIYNSRPEWYEGSGSLHASSLANDLGGMSSVTRSAMASQPSSAGSGGSGFSGGGSGGGGGGGGGGSW